MGWLMKTLKDVMHGVREASQDSNSLRAAHSDTALEGVTEAAPHQRVEHRRVVADLTHPQKRQKT